MCISIFLTILFYKKIRSLIIRFISYSILIAIGVVVFFIWPFDDKGKIVYLETLIGFGLIFPVFIVLIVRYFYNLNKSIIDQKIKDAKTIANALNLDVMGIEESIKTKQDLISYRGNLSGIYPFSISETIDFFQTNKGVNNTATVKLDHHFTKFRFAITAQKSTQFRIFTNQKHYAKVETPFVNATKYQTFNLEFENKFSIQYSKNSRLKFFFDKSRIQELLLTNYDNIRGIMDFNIEEGICLVKSACPSQKNISLFNRNWRDDVNTLTINDIKDKLNFVDVFLKELIEFETNA
jgi:hypothetical protein